MSQTVLGDVGDVLFVDQHLPGGGVVEALNQRENRRFSSPGSADEPYLLSGGNMQVQAFQNAMTVRIVERDVRECHRSAKADQRLGVRRIFHFVRQPQNLNGFAQLGEV